MSAAVELVNDMLEMVIFGDPEQAVEMAQEASDPVKKAAAEHAQIVIYSSTNDEKIEGLQHVIKLLTASPDQVDAAVAEVKAASGMSNTTKALLVGGGLLAVYFLFIKK